MNSILHEMLAKYDVVSEIDRKNAVKEIMQEIVLCGLSKAGLFREAAFYGGTALRIFYGLDRFSEDLDFSLLDKDVDFRLDKYFEVLENEIKSFGLNMSIEQKNKVVDSNIKSAFLKGDTKEHLLKFYSDEIFSNINHNELIKIKLEVDISPPKFATFERKYELLPMPYEINIYDRQSLFAGKIHAILCRNWKNRVKGRDYYDYVFYLSRGIKYNHRHLCERLYESGMKDARNYSMDDIRKLLGEKFNEVDFKKAKEDVMPFIKDISLLEIWSKDFFTGITDKLEGV